MELSTIYVLQNGVRQGNLGSKISLPSNWYFYLADSGPQMAWISERVPRFPIAAMKSDWKSLDP